VLRGAWWIWTLTATASAVLIIGAFKPQLAASFASVCNLLVQQAWRGR
jgi:hypothetical protein